MGIRPSRTTSVPLKKGIGQQPKQIRRETISTVGLRAARASQTVPKTALTPTDARDWLPKQARYTAVSGPRPPGSSQQDRPPAPQAGGMRCRQGSVRSGVAPFVTHRLRGASRLSDMVRATVAAPQQLIQPRRRLLLHTGKDVRIGVQRERDRRVPEHLLHDLGMLAVYEAYSQFPTHPPSSRQAPEFLGYHLGYHSPLFAPNPTDTKKPEARLPTGLPASEPGGSRTHDLRIKSPLLYQLSYRLRR